MPCVPRPAYAACGGNIAFPLSWCRQISAMALDTGECCSLARTLGLRLTERLPGGANSTTDDAGGADVQATGDGRAGKDYGSIVVVRLCQSHIHIADRRRRCT